MKRTARLVWVAILSALTATMAFAGDTAPAPAPAANTNAPAKIKLPRLVDLGADKCIPCKKMAPILSELKSNYVGQLEVEFIDVWKNPDAARPYKVRLIPTQIFFDATGRELFRHEGFFGKEDMLAKWRELGVDLKNQK
jgi:thioredoxin 1